jgi:hypothetical protein
MLYGPLWSQLNNVADVPTMRRRAFNMNDGIDGTVDDL